MLSKFAALLFGGLLLLLVQPILTQSTPDYTCSPTKPCTLGCCGPMFVPSGLLSRNDYQLMLLTATKPLEQASVAWGQPFAPRETARANAMPSRSVTRAGGSSGHKLRIVRSMSVVRSLGFAEPLRSFVMAKLFLRLNVRVERAPIRGRLGIMKGGTWEGHVGVS